MFERFVRWSFALSFVGLTGMRWAPARPGLEDDGTLPFAMPERYGPYKEQGIGLYQESRLDGFITSSKRKRNR